MYQITPFIFCIYFFADRNDQRDQEDNDYNSQGASSFDFHANDQTGKERENGGNGNGNEPQNNNCSANGEQKEKINSRFS